LSVKYTIINKVFTLTCSGSGSIGLTNMLYTAGPSGYYDVYHNGVFVESKNTNDYTITSCSTWEFRPSKIVNEEQVQRALNPFFGAFALIIVGLLAAAGLALVMAIQSGDSQVITTTAIIMFTVAIVVMIGVFILGNVASILP